jgi:SAM-dependent methyltransferase
MDVQERLTLEAISAHTLIALEHVHRYEFASELCAGLRVADVGCGSGYGAEILRGTAEHVHAIDIDPGTIDTAIATIGRRTDIEFEVADVQEFLSRDLAPSFDAVVMLETLEHLPDLDGTWRSLARQAEAGLRLVISVPNSRTFEEENEFHVTDFGYEEAVELFSELDDVVLAYQFTAEGSLLGIDPGVETTEKVVLADRAEVPYANHFLACVNFGGPDAVSAALSARLQLNAAPVHTRYHRHLERANRELQSTNARLGRELLGQANAAAARVVDLMEQRVEAQQERASIAEAVLQHRDARIAELEGKIAEQEAVMLAVWNSASWRITRPLRTAKERLRGSAER